MNVLKPEKISALTDSIDRHRSKTPAAYRPLLLPSLPFYNAPLWISYEPKNKRKHTRTSRQCLPGRIKEHVISEEGGKRCATIIVT